VRARDSYERHRSPAYAEWEADRAKEIADAKAQQEAAEAARIAADPVLQFQKSTNELYATEQQAVLHGVVNEIYLASFGHYRKGTCSEEEKVAARTKFRETATDYIRNKTNGATLCAMVSRNNLHPGDVESYLVCHEILKLWGGYVDADPIEEAPVPTEEVAPVLTRSEQMVINHQKFMTDIVVVDELGTQWTAAMLDKLPAKEELRLRRLGEKGHRGDSLMDQFYEVKDIQQARDLENARLAPEDRDERL
jgi:hypothetical protein